MGGPFALILVFRKFSPIYLSAMDLLLLTSDVALAATLDHPAGLVLTRAPLDIGTRGRVMGHPYQPVLAQFLWSGHTS